MGSTLGKINEKINNVLERLQNLEYVVASMDVKLDKILECNNNTIVNEDKLENLQFKIEFPINTIEELEKLERELVNAEIKASLVNIKISIISCYCCNWLQIKKFSSIGGTSGKENGLKVCRILIDAIFLRSFLKSFTWSGKSISKEKRFFKIHVEFISFFFEIVHKADINFTKLNSDQFLKNIIKQ